MAPAQPRMCAPRLMMRDGPIGGRRVGFRTKETAAPQGGRAIPVL